MQNIKVAIVGKDRTVHADPLGLVAEGKYQ